MSQEHEKILFKFYSGIFDQDMTEALWATPVDKEKGLYLLNNFPIYASLIASEDLVRAEFDEKENMQVYKETVDYSGNSVIQVIILNEDTDANDIKKQFDHLACDTEVVQSNYFVMGISYETDYKPVKAKLNELEANGLIGYGEPCLSEKHGSDLNK